MNLQNSNYRAKSGKGRYFITVKLILMLNDLVGYKRNTSTLQTVIWSPMQIQFRMRFHKMVTIAEKETAYLSDIDLIS